METKNQKGIYHLLGAAFLAQSILPLIGGLVFQSLEVESEITATMRNIAGSIPTVWMTILLWIVSGIFVIILGTALYQITSRQNKTAAMIAYGMYLLEAFLAIVGQMCVFALSKLSLEFAAGGSASLLDLGNALLLCRHFAGEIAMLPFGVGALIFYSLLMKEGTIPKWLAIWGLVTAPLIMFGVPLSTFGVAVPAFVLAPYVPFEFFTGAYLLIRYRGKSAQTTPAAV
ncbi:MAG TPA: DUF4386 domain-containing protein [Candidatus Cryosericum sp.]|nr:DUF4386 domain-containing protein [Candidatus Cryosericum sp.]